MCRAVPAYYSHSQTFDQISRDSFSFRRLQKKRKKRNTRRLNLKGGDTTSLPFTIKHTSCHIYHTVLTSSPLKETLKKKHFPSSSWLQAAYSPVCSEAERDGRRMMAAAREGGVKKRQLHFQHPPQHTHYSECESRGGGGGGTQAEVTASGGAAGKQQQTATQRAGLNEV